MVAWKVFQGFSEALWRYVTCVTGVLLLGQKTGRAGDVFWESSNCTRTVIETREKSNDSSFTWWPSMVGPKLWDFTTLKFNIFAPEKGWLEDDPFLLVWYSFRGELLNFQGVFGLKILWPQSCWGCDKDHPKGCKRSPVSKGDLYIKETMQANTPEFFFQSVKLIPGEPIPTKINKQVQFQCVLSAVNQKTIHCNYIYTCIISIHEHIPTYSCISICRIFIMNTHLCIYSTLRRVKFEP